MVRESGSVGRARSPSEPPVRRRFFYLSVTRSYAQLPAFTRGFPRLPSDLDALFRVFRGLGATLSALGAGGEVIWRSLRSLRTSLNPWINHATRNTHHKLYLDCQRATGLLPQPETNSGPVLHSASRRRTSNAVTVAHFVSMSSYVPIKRCPTNSAPAFGVRARQRRFQQVPRTAWSAALKDSAGRFASHSAKRIGKPAER